MHRRPLLAMLDRYEARYPAEGAVVARIRALVESHADCFERACRPGHVTASAWIVAPGSDRVLLVHHRKLDRWLQPGGHCDGQPDPAAAALREAEEETGLNRLRLSDPSPEVIPLDLDVHEIPPRYGANGQLIEDAHEHHDVRFLIVAPGDQPPRVSEESHAVRWFTPQELAAVTNEESVLRMARKAKSVGSSR